MALYPTSQPSLPGILDSEPTWAAVTTVLGSFLNENILVQPDKVQLLWIFYILVLGLGLVHYRKNVSRFLFLATLFAVPKSAS